MTAQADYEAYVLSLNPIAYWDFQGLAPGALVDRSGNGHALAGFGAYSLAHSTPLDGFMAAQFDGATAYFTPGGGGLHPAKWSVLSILYPTAGPGQIFNTESAAALNVSGMGVYVGDAGHNFGFGDRVDFAGGNVTNGTNQSFGAFGAGFVQVMASYDGVNLAVSVNGSVAAALPAPNFVVGATQAQLGRAAYSASVFFTGFMSDTAIFDYPLLQSDVAQSVSNAGLQGALSAPQVNKILAEILASVRKTY